MKTKPMTDFEKALNYYRSGMRGVRPDWVPARVRLPVGVRGDGLFHTTYATSGEHACVSNQWGALSVTAANGQSLGIKPAEFEVVKWRRNPHKKAA